MLDAAHLCISDGGELLAAVASNLGASTYVLILRIIGTEWSKVARHSTGASITNRGTGRNKNGTTRR